MADAVDTLTPIKGGNRIIIRCTNVSDGTGESAVIKIDKSTLIGPDGVNEPGKIVLEEVQWSIQGFSSVRLFWDHTTDDEICVLGTGNGYFNFKNAGGLTDPASSGGTGDVLLTTAGAISGATYDITLVCRLKK